MLDSNSCGVITTHKQEKGYQNLTLNKPYENVPAYHL